MLLAARAEDGLECDGIDLEFLQETFGVSRSHVRNILSAAEAGGLLAWSGPDRRAPRLTPRGLFAVDRFIADTLSSNDMSYRMARMRMGLDPGRPPGD